MKWFGCSDRVLWRDAGLAVEAQPGWCLDPSIPDGDELGFVACAEDFDQHQFERQLRSAGFDPFGVPVVVLTKFDRDSEDRLRVLLAAAAARASAFAGSGPEHVQPVMPSSVSRRSLITFRLPAYRPVPNADANACGAGDGCRKCVDVCPHGALEWSHGSIAHDRLECQGCGRCVTTCPVGAMINPAYTPDQLEAEVSAVVAAQIGSCGIQLHCSRTAAPASRAGWFNAALPCVGMLNASWVLAPLVAGAAGVAVSPCECGLEPDSQVRALAAVRGARDWLSAAGWDDAPDRVLDAPADQLREPVPLLVKGSGFEAAGGAAVALALGDTIWQSDAAPTGIVAIDEVLCTGCEMCATVCPGGALTSHVADGTLEIEFDAPLCTACGQCVARCPEADAIALQSIVDTDELRLGQRRLVAHTMVSCVNCGGAVAPQAALSRITALLGDDAASTKQITSLCLDCRGTRLVL